MYLGCFERIVAQTVADLGGPSDWALPYWNYNAGPASRKLPAAFTQSQLPDGSANALLEANRDNGNNGQPFLGAGGLNPKPAFKETQFAAGAGVSGFGGPITNFRHGGGPFGTLENQPHNHVHVDIGGLMSDPDTAALDPIFWLHHANIDRLWEAWLNTNPPHNNPPNSNWLSFKFDLHDAKGKAVKLKANDILKTKLAPFYYQYDDISVPADAKGVTARVVPRGAGIMEEQPIPEMVGASTGPAKLASQTQTLAVKLFPVSGPHLRKLGIAGAPFRKAYLHVENVRGQGPPASYDIYLNAPEGASEPPEKFYVGTAATFGLRRASIGNERHAGSGLHFTFDVTDVVNTLKSEERWNPEELRVTFVPSRKPSGGSEIEVGRVSLYYR
jgi:tyrosinase